VTRSLARLTKKSVNIDHASDNNKSTTTERNSMDKGSL
jgi:hypothetical protein